MPSWYNAERFRSHVREPDVDNLLYIARDLHLVDVRVIRRNWWGIASQSRIIALTARATDSLLRPFPTLCSNLYLSGRKAADGRRHGASHTRTNVLFSSAEEGGRALVVTSTAPREGKSLVSSNLAISLAQAGQRTLLSMPTCASRRRTTSSASARSRASRTCWWATPR